MRSEDYLSVRKIRLSYLILVLLGLLSCSPVPKLSEDTSNNIALCGAGLQRSASIEFSTQVSQAARISKASLASNGQIRAAFLGFAWSSDINALEAYHAYLDCAEGRVNLAEVEKSILSRKEVIQNFLKQNEASTDLIELASTYSNRRIDALRARDFIGEMTIRSKFINALQRGLPGIPFSKVPLDVLQSKGFSEDSRYLQLTSDAQNKRSKEVERLRQLCLLFADDDRSRCGREALSTLGEFDRKASTYINLCQASGELLPKGFAKTPNDVQRWIEYRTCSCVNTSKLSTDECWKRHSPLGW